MATFYTDADLAGAGEFSDPELTLATEFTVPDGNVNWLRWRCPSSAPGVTPQFRIYDAANNVVATVPLDGAVATGAWNQGTPGSPIALTAGTYRASINTTTYLARANFFSGGPIVRGDITGVQGRFANGVAAPGGGTNSAYFVDIDFGDAPVDPAEGSVAIGLGLAVAATGGRSSSGVVALGAGLAVAATGSRASRGSAAVGLGLAVAASGSSPARGTVALTLGLGVAATGARASLGAADVGLGLVPAATGARPSGGSAAVGLNLAVSASGSNGDTGRPVTPFPFTPRPGSTYPWTPRPVKSFQEVES